MVRAGLKPAPTRCPCATRPEEPKINGRKRHIVVGTIGLILAVVVHSAGSKTAMEPSWSLDAPDRQTQRRCGRFRAADSHPPLPRRWVVERTFAWLGRSACRQAGTAA